ncbi:MFS transporter [Desulfonema ishimotonii]|uniref:MFS transporter n=2 Tax=Desulfonema ishimotonii TaxID=45657 RepID=A0A401FZ61_9BACT|nr:MFS transporter [Desulfonema ishimotonii]
MSTLDGSIVNIALPAIMADLAAPLPTIEWVMMIYLLTVTACLLSFGRLSDIRGRRWIYIRGLIVFSAGSLACGMARSAIWLISARAFQGLGAAMIMSCNQAILTETFPAAERGKALGMLGAVVASGLTAGPVLGGWIIHFFSWQTIFYINIPIGLLTALAGNRILRGGKADRVRAETFDRSGALLLAISVSTFVYILTHGYDLGYTSYPMLLLGGAFIVSAAGFVYGLFSVPHPIIVPSLLGIRLFIFPVLATMILFAGLFTMIFLMPFYLINPCGFSPKMTGYIMVTPFMCLFIFSPIAGVLSDRIGSRLLCTAGMGILTFSFFYLARLMPDSSPPDIAGRLALFGLGTAAFTAPNNVTIMSAVPREHMGIAAGTVATVRNMGMVLGIALSGAVFNNVFYRLSGGLSLKVYQPQLEPIFMDAFRYAMTAGGLVAGIGIIISFLRGPEKK